MIASPPLAKASSGPHNLAMNLKSAAFLAVIGTLLLTILLTFDFVKLVLGVARDIVPLLALIRAAIYLFASLSVTVFCFVFYRDRS
jgi:hypothetical protein